MNIPVFKPPFFDSKNQITECIKSGWLGYGKVSNKVENIFSKRGGWSIATNSCTSALNIAARILFDEKFNEVIIPSITFISTAMAFYDAGWTIKLADVAIKNGLIDFNKIENLFTSKTGAIVIVDLYGQNAKDSINLYEKLKSTNIKLVLDLAHRIDNLNEKPHADFCCYSFNAVKEITCGEGGLLWGNNSILEEKAREVSYLGLKQTTYSKVASHLHMADIFTKNRGLKCLMSDLQASIIVDQITFHTINSRRKRRQEIFEQYDKSLHKCNAIRLIERDDDDSYLMYIIKLENEIVRQNLRDYLKTNGISTAIHYPTLDLHPIFSSNNVPQSRDFSSRVLTLPCYYDLKDSEQQYIITLILNYFRNESKNHL